MKGERLPCSQKKMYFCKNHFSIPMKRILLIIIMIGIAAFTSCHKSGVNLFVGDYSFKTSGDITLMAEAQTDSSHIIIPTLLDVSLEQEIGQLNITHDGDSKDRVTVMINYMNGDVVVTKGTCDGTRIQLDEFRRKMLPISTTSFFTDNFYVKLSGTGQMYDDDIIVFDMSYIGKATISSVTFNIKDKDVKMVAYRN